MTAGTVMAFIWSFRNGDGLKISNSDMAERLGTSEGNIRKAMCSIKKMGYSQTKKGTSGRRLYPTQKAADLVAEIERKWEDKEKNSTTRVAELKDNSTTIVAEPNSNSTTIVAKLYHPGGNIREEENKTNSGERTDEINVNDNSPSHESTGQPLVSLERMGAAGNGGADFEGRFWPAYPKRMKKQDVLKAWLQLNPGPELVEQILTAVQNHSRSEQWTKEEGQYIPYPATWLRGQQWTDEIPTGPKPEPLKTINGKTGVEILRERHGR